MNHRARERRRRRTQEHMAGQRRRRERALEHAAERTRSRKRGAKFFAEAMAEQGYVLRTRVIRVRPARHRGPSRNVEVTRWIRLPR